MLIHSVYFWLKSDLTDAQRAEFLGGLESLKGVQAAQQVYIGKPAPTPKRPVVEDTYSYALTIVCRDVAGHDAYQIDPLHKAFVEKFKSYWDRVRIYDAM
jgi:hypothetical protein